MKKILNIITILFSIIIISSLVSAESNLSLQINFHDNVTKSPDNWNCTISNGTASQFVNVTAGDALLHRTNMSYANLLCQRGNNATLQYILNTTVDLNFTGGTNISCNISYVRFNLTENHSLTSYTRDNDIMFQYNITNFEANVANDTTVKAYLTEDGLRTGCATQTNLYDFTAGAEHLVNVTLDLTSCAIRSYYLDYGVFDLGDTTAIAYMSCIFPTQYEEMEEIVFRRETISVTEGSSSVISDDTLEGLPEMGTQIGDFLGNIVPGLGKFLIVVGLFAGIVAIIGSIVFVISILVKNVANYKDKK